MVTALLLSVCVAQASQPGPLLEFGDQTRVGLEPTSPAIAVTVSQGLVFVHWSDRRLALPDDPREDLWEAIVPLDGGVSAQTRLALRSPRGTAARSPSVAVGLSRWALAWEQRIVLDQALGFDAGTRFAIVGLGDATGGDAGIVRLLTATGTAPRVASLGDTFALTFSNAGRLFLGLSVRGEEPTAELVPVTPLSPPRIARSGNTLFVGTTLADDAGAATLVRGPLESWAGIDGGRPVVGPPGTLVELVGTAAGTTIALLRGDRAYSFVEGNTEGPQYPGNVTGLAPFSNGALAIAPDDRVLLRVSQGTLQSEGWPHERMIAVGGAPVGAAVVQETSQGKGLSLRQVFPLPDGGLRIEPRAAPLTLALRPQRLPSVAWAQAVGGFLVGWDEYAANDKWLSAGAFVALDGGIREVLAGVDNTPEDGPTQTRLYASPDRMTVALARRFGTDWMLRSFNVQNQRFDRDLIRLPIAARHASFDPSFSVVWREDPKLSVATSVDRFDTPLAGEGIRCGAVLEGSHWLPRWRGRQLDFRVFSPDASVDGPQSDIVEPDGGSLCASRADDRSGIVVWARDGQRVGVLPFGPGAGEESFGQLRTLEARQPVDPVAVAFDGGTLVVWSTGTTGVEGAVIPSGSGPSIPVTFRTDAGFVGPPALAIAPSGEALVAWHEFDEQGESLRIRARLFRPLIPSATDAGAPQDAGLDAGEPDGGLPIDGGAMGSATVFQANGCGCQAGTGGAQLAMVMALLAARARRRRPGSTEPRPRR
jgi:hypothetical protein